MRKALLLKGETWFPQKSKTISPREILLSLSNRVRYRTANDGRTLPLVRECSPEAFRDWIYKWGSKI